MRFLANGDVSLGKALPEAKLDVAGKVRCEVLELTSDRNQKSGFTPLAPRTILDKVSGLAITAWHYTNSPTVQHIGPMAQDFHAAFGVGESDKHISVVDGLGVALAAIQGLNETIKEKDTRIAALENKLADQERTITARLAALEKVVAQATGIKSSDEMSNLTPNGGNHGEASLNSASVR